MAVLRLIDQLVLGRRLHRHVGRLLALEDAIDIAGRAPVLVDQIGSVGDQPAGGNNEASEVDGGQLVPSRQCDDQVAMNRRWRAPRHDQAAIGGARERRDGALDLASVTHADGTQFHAERRRHALDSSELSDPGAFVGIPNDRRSFHARRDLLEQLQPFRAEAVFIRHEAGDVSAGVRKALDETSADRIGNNSEHDRHGAGGPVQRHNGIAAGQDDVRAECDQFRCVSTTALGIAGTPAVVDPHIAALGPAQLLQAICERYQTGLSFRAVCGHAHEHADAPHPLTLLRPRRERPRRRAAEQRDELPPSHAGHGRSLPQGLPHRQPATGEAGRSMG